ncbi:hypothetical protein P308_27275 [Pseudomonas piscis]|nr:hypothetical protein P308_27275 [Pseudomonas piscis]
MFLVNVPLAGACALLARRWIPADPPRQRGRQFDLPGALSVTLGGTLLVFAIVQGPEWGWAAPATLACLLLALALLGLFLRIERLGRDPLMPLRLLGYPQLRMAMLITALFMSSFGVQYYFLSLYFQQVYQFSVLHSGLAFLPSTVLCTLGIWLGERALRRASLRAVLACGLLAGALGIGMIYLALPGSRGFVGLLPGIVIMSIGQGMTWNTMWISAGQGIAATEQGVAAGVASTSQQIGGALGLALLVSLANTLGPVGNQAYGIELATAASALLALLGALLALRLPHSPVALPGCSAASG